MKNFSLIFLLYLGLACGSGAAVLAAKDAQRERFTLTSDEGNVTYIVEAWLPTSYLGNPRPMPLLLMLDGEYAFNSAVQLSEYLQRNAETQEFIIVGVSYGVGFGKPLAVERTRDFTPPLDRERLIMKSETPYYRFIKNRLWPELRERYQIDPAQRTLWGYSLSGAFALWLNYFDPSLFDHYILASANSDFGLLQKLFQGQMFSSGEYRGRRVFFSYDYPAEIPDPKIVEDGKKLLANKEMFPGHEMRLFLTSGESHATSWFVSLPTALRFVFGPAKGDGGGTRKEPSAAAAASASP